ncbi:hypothetical protein C7974DRAFT_387039 [Boeremia exigua]|uniref:uncharacterized protein n=1 Tax=Boeremia exigua TaxID=749465 RepID=UPI001E8E1C82|nr:uncharacterized protein C7974DRAFT_387039 [Boeremia exigua]KAH6643211.1 hypothetical protein C7974DRAFT_387039 [Boeremia exigua]
MATLFRDFSFAAPSPSLAAHEAERALMNCSPTSQPTHHPVRSPPTPPCTMGNLAQLMDGQNLLVTTSPARSRSLHLPPGPTDASDNGNSPSDSLDRPTYCRASASIMRMQRQVDVGSQAKDIARLLRMIEDEEQCSVSESARPAFGASSDDEGIDMDYDCPLRVVEPLFSRPLYRAGDRHNDSARVTKTVRMRKRSGPAKEPKQRRKTA